MTRIFCMILTYLYIVAQQCNANYTKSDSNYILIDFLNRISVNGSNVIISERCREHMNILKESVVTRRIWAIKALEASATLPSNYLYGNNFWLGSKWECEMISNPKAPTLSKDFYKKANQHLMETPDELIFRYKVARANYFSAIQANTRYFMNADILHVGLCLPETCTNDDAKVLIKGYFEEKETLIQDLFNITISDLRISDLELRQGFFYKPTFIILCMIFVATISLTIFSTLSTLNYSLKTDNGHLANIVKAFCPVSNANAIYDNKKCEFPEINGLRVISSLLILAFHVQYFSFYKAKSRFNMFIIAEEIQTVLITNGPIFVEVFFVISGILLTYGYLKNESQTHKLAGAHLGKCISFIIEMILKRLVRIVPLYFVVILMSEVSGTYFADTAVIEPYERYDLNCKNYWWRNLLFIQNFYPFNELCLNWSWTLACDMQYFLITTVMYVIYCKNKLFGKTFFAMTALFFLGSSSFLVAYFQFRPTFDILFTTLDELYHSPLSRAPSYFVGVATGYIIAKKDIKMSNIQWHLTWIVIFCITWFSVLITMYRTAPLWMAVPILSAGKWIFPACAAWWGISSTLGHQNIITFLLSHPIVQHFGKISYGFYLLNPFLILYALSHSDYPMEIDPITSFIFTMGINILNYIFALIFTILFEMPYNNLLRLYTKKSTNKS